MTRSNFIPDFLFRFWLQKQPCECWGIRTESTSPAHPNGDCRTLVGGSVIVTLEAHLPNANVRRRWQCRVLLQLSKIMKITSASSKKEPSKPQGGEGDVVFIEVYVKERQKSQARASRRCPPNHLGGRRHCHVDRFS